MAPFHVFGVRVRHALLSFSVPSDPVCLRTNAGN
jgi:hypothetical protein